MVRRIVKAIIIYVTSYDVMCVDSRRPTKHDFRFLFFFSDYKKDFVVVVETLAFTCVDRVYV